MSRPDPVLRTSKKCAGCGKKITSNRYALKIVCYAAYDGLEIRPEDLSEDLSAQIDRQIRSLKNVPARRLCDEVVKYWKYSLCSACAAKYRRSPLKGLKKTVSKKISTVRRKKSAHKNTK